MKANENGGGQHTPQKHKIDICMLIKNKFDFLRIITFKLKRFDQNWMAKYEIIGPHEIVPKTLVLI